MKMGGLYPLANPPPADHRRYGHLFQNRCKSIVCQDDLVKKNLRVSGQRINIAALAQLTCNNYNISPGELRSGSRRRDLTKARGSISWIAVRELGYSGADVARYLGVADSCVTRFDASRQNPDVDDLITKR